MARMRKYNDLSKLDLSDLKYSGGPVNDFPGTPDPFADIEDIKENTRKGIEAVNNLTVAELLSFAGIKGAVGQEALDFIGSLHAAAKLMLKRIEERHPADWDTKRPSSFPEVEIYDSVFGILEEDEIAAITVSFGMSDATGSKLLTISKDIFKRIEEMVFKEPEMDNSDRDEMVDMLINANPGMFQDLSASEIKSAAKLSYASPQPGPAPRR